MLQPEFKALNALEYQKEADYNVWVSFLRDPQIVDCFGRIDEQMTDIVAFLNKSADLTAKDYFFYQSLFWIVANRQLRNAFTACVRRTSHDAMLIVRPALESTVFAYRIYKDPELLKVWANKRGNPAAYNKHFRFAAYPPDMPHSADFRVYVDRLNEHCAHPNLNYFASAVEFEAGVMHVNYFDRKSERNYYLQILTIVLYGMRILEVMRATLAPRFVVYVTSTDAAWNTLQHDFRQLSDYYNRRYNLHQRLATP